MASITKNTYKIVEMVIASFYIIAHVALTIKDIHKHYKNTNDILLLICCYVRMMQISSSLSCLQSVYWTDLIILYLLDFYKCSYLLVYSIFYEKCFDNYRESCSVQEGNVVSFSTKSQEHFIYYDNKF